MTEVLDKESSFSRPKKEVGSSTAHIINEAVEKRGRELLQGLCQLWGHAATRKGITLKDSEWIKAKIAIVQKVLDSENSIVGEVSRNLSINEVNKKLSIEDGVEIIDMAIIGYEDWEDEDTGEVFEIPIIKEVVKTK